MSSVELRRYTSVEDTILNLQAIDDPSDGINIDDTRLRQTSRGHSILGSCGHWKFCSRTKCCNRTVVVVQANATSTASTGADVSFQTRRVRTERSTTDGVARAKEINKLYFKYLTITYKKDLSYLFNVVLTQIQDPDKSFWRNWIASPGECEEFITEDQEKELSIRLQTAKLLYDKLRAKLYQDSLVEAISPAQVKSSSHRILSVGDAIDSIDQMTMGTPVVEDSRRISKSVQADRMLGDLSHSQHYGSDMQSMVEFDPTAAVVEEFDQEEDQLDKSSEHRERRFLRRTRSLNSLQNVTLPEEDQRFVGESFYDKHSTRGRNATANAECFDLDEDISDEEDDAWIPEYDYSSKKGAKASDRSKWTVSYFDSPYSSSVLSYQQRQLSRQAEIDDERQSQASLEEQAKKERIASEREAIIESLQLKVSIRDRLIQPFNIDVLVKDIKTMISCDDSVAEELAKQIRRKLIEERLGDENQIVTDTVTPQEIFDMVAKVLSDRPALQTSVDLSEDELLNRCIQSNQHLGEKLNNIRKVDDLDPSEFLALMNAYDEASRDRSRERQRRTSSTRRGRFSLTNIFS